MIGLEFILDLYQMQQKDLAEQLGIHKQNITTWIKGNHKIPKKYLPTLQSTFNIPEEYFQKELSEIDMLLIQNIKLGQELDQRSFDYDDTVYDEKSGKEIQIRKTHYDQSIVEQQKFNDVQIDELRTIQKIGYIISKQEESDDIYNLMGKIANRTRLFDRFADIVQSEEISYQMLHEVMRAIELATQALKDRNKIWGKGRPNSEAVEDQRPIVQDLFSILNKYHQEKEKEALELLEMFPQDDTNDDDFN